MLEILEQMDGRVFSTARTRRDAVRLSSLSPVM